jgi:hypothetical protein
MEFVFTLRAKVHDLRGRATLLVSLYCDGFGYHSIKVQGIRKGFPCARPGVLWFSSSVHSKFQNLYFCNQCFLY